MEPGPSFQITDTFVTGAGNNKTATLTFTVNKSCEDEKESLQSVQVFRRDKTMFEAPECFITFKNDACSLNLGCLCDSQSRTFSVTTPGDNLDRITLLLIGELEHGLKFNKTVAIHLHSSHSTSTSTGAVSLSEASDATKTQRPVSARSDGSTIEAAAAEPPRDSGTQLGLFILGGVVGLVLLVVIFLSICVGVLFRKRGRPRRLPPPPAPHNVRRAACDGVVVHAARRDRRVSSDCSQGDDYAEIQDDTDLSRSESSLASCPMSTVSDSSMSDDCLHYIACPSSDSTLPEDYLNPVVSFGGTAAIENSNEDNSNSSSSSEAVMYAKERITFKKQIRKKVSPAQAESPYENPANMQ